MKGSQAKKAEKKNQIALFPFVCCFCFVCAFSFQGHTKVTPTTRRLNFRTEKVVPCEDVNGTPEGTNFQRVHVPCDRRPNGRNNCWRENELAYSPLHCDTFTTTTNVTRITKKNYCDYDEQKQTNNALRYRVDPKMEGFKNWNWKLKKGDSNQFLLSDSEHTLEYSRLYVASKPRLNSYIKSFLHPRKRAISSFLLFAEFSQRTICITLKRLETRD